MEKYPSDEKIYPKTLDILRARDKLKTAQMNLALKIASVEAAKQELAAAETVMNDVLSGGSADSSRNAH